MEITCIYKNIKRSVFHFHLPFKSKVSFSSICSFYSIVMRSCVDLYHEGIRKNGIYKVLNQAGALFPVICDFESENRTAWTLLTSYSLQNVTSFRTPFYINTPRNENNPNWVDYRYDCYDSFEYGSMKLRVTKCILSILNTILLAYNIQR